MNHRMSFFGAILVAGACAVGGAGAQTTLNVVTAGDQNMVDYVNNYLAPKFEAMNPASRCVRWGQGRRFRIAEDLREAVSAAEGGHRGVGCRCRGCPPARRGDDGERKAADVLSQRCRRGKLVSRDTAKNALGANVDGYVLPMFHSQIAFAYNPDLVKTPPKSYAELTEWVKKNPKQFGYNGVEGRHVRRRVRDGLGGR
jgi:hypothetical protein